MYLPLFTILLAMLVIGVHGLHVFLGVQPRIGTWVIPKSVSAIAVALSIAIIVYTMYNWRA